VTWDDLVEIVATFVSIHNSNFHCRTSERKGCFELVPKWRRDQMKGCGELSVKPVMIWKDRLRFFKCPTNIKNGYVEELIGLNRQYENGILPYEGSLFSQPAKLVEVFNQTNSLRLDEEISRSKHEEKKWQKTKLKSR
jgi:hypothetical protein